MEGFIKCIKDNIEIITTIGVIGTFIGVIFGIYYNTPKARAKRAEKINIKRRNPITRIKNYFKRKKDKDILKKYTDICKLEGWIAKYIPDTNKIEEWIYMPKLSRKERECDQTLKMRRTLSNPNTIPRDNVLIDILVIGDIMETDENPLNS